MKRVTYAVTPREGHFDPTEKRCREHGVRFVAIHDIDMLEDGTVNAFFEVSGTPSRLRAAFSGRLPRLVDSEIIADDETTMIQLRYQPTELTQKLLQPHRAHGVIVQYPMEFVDSDRSTLRVTVIGPEDDIRRLISETEEFVDLTVENVTDYCPSTTQQFHELTTRQQEVLVTAYERGYYEDPRRATYEDIAADLDCSASSVGQILRRAESTLVSTTVPDRTLESS